MALVRGTRLGPYEIIAPIGAGGMGEVYRAVDTNLKRSVAIKVLPDSLAADAGRLARFQREAEILASLDHRNIGQIHGLENSAGITALVLELIAGPTLADRIAEGPIPIDEAVAIAAQVADGLEAAHERGVVHRDLKPANIKLRPDGTVKILDFGIAKALLPHRPAGDPTEEESTVFDSRTQAGMILGTPAYMSPEQARGRPVDKRTDIWAFGCLLYEMLVGRRPFVADSLADTIAAILDGRPDWNALPEKVPSSIRRLLARCIEPDPRRRLRDIGEARLVLEDAIAGVAEPPGAESQVRPPDRRRILLVVLAAVLLTAALLVPMIWMTLRPDPSPVSRLSIVPPRDARLAEGALAVAPDGSRVAFVSGNGSQISVRSIGELSPRHIVNLGKATQPFISPDGEWIGFFDGLNTLQRVSITGGPPMTVAPLGGAAPRGASWSPRGTIIFATDDPASGLWQVSLSGGAPVMITRPRHLDHYWPHVLPGGRAVLFTQILVTTAAGEAAETVGVLDLETGAEKILMTGSHAQYVPTGHLLYAASGSLRAIRFDVDRLEVIGISVPILDSFPTSSLSPAQFGVSANGSLAYVTGFGDSHEVSRRLVWVDRDGNEELLGAGMGRYAIPRISPDGTKVVLDDRAIDGLSMWDLAGRTMKRFTFAVDAYPVWSRDGQRVAFTSFDPNTGVGYLSWQAADGGGGPVRLAEAPASRYASSFTPDGTRLLYRQEAGAGGLDIAVLTIGSPGRSDPLIETAASELNPEISPDGRWLAYESDRSTRAEIYVCPFPGVNGGLWQVSAGGGTQPAWSRSGSEIFYRRPEGALMAVPVQIEPRFAAGAPIQVVRPGYFMGGPFRSYDPAPDGSRFLMVKSDDETKPESEPSIVVVSNWHAELERLVPRR